MAFENTATGTAALWSDTTGNGNTLADGVSALYSNVFGIDNTGIGFNALYKNGRQLQYLRSALMRGFNLYHGRFSNIDIGLIPALR